MDTSKKRIKTIDEYMALHPKEVRSKLKEIRKVIKDIVPEATEAIKYQIPTFILYGNLVHFAAFKKHIGFYPTPSAIEEFSDELSTYVVSKGAIQFPLDKPIPLDLVKNIVKYRVKESLEKKH
ncbi:MAG: hypothetical protein UR34_C0011G0031 [candidate division WS6 bacterium GW2011_GWC1_33_20]|uniref:YdhG-like domain-containing protein n=1 Tax=candidate division WS6 bacterium GW2011_GWC1_33_20 TaxID=1619089 RepID=A0A0G0CK24_9BACT|nr:MAG: hypothetical protein UR34_C0011G0031 [candidate division WS6 bacterium GW2011_GWC1_33_20]HBB64364.1 hypothetical protein [Patescibacteria group bacterium]